MYISCVSVRVCVCVRVSTCACVGVSVCVYIHMLIYVNGGKHAHVLNLLTTFTATLRTVTLLLSHLSTRNLYSGTG